MPLNENIFFKKKQKDGKIVHLHKKDRLNGSGLGRSETLGKMHCKKTALPQPTVDFEIGDNKGYNFHTKKYWGLKWDVRDKEHSRTATN